MEVSGGMRDCFTSFLPRSLMSMVKPVNSPLCSSHSTSMPV